MGNILQILGRLMADAAAFKAGITAVEQIMAEAKVGRMPTPQQVAAVEKIVADLVQLAGAL